MYPGVKAAGVTYLTDIRNLVRRAGSSASSLLLASLIPWKSTKALAAAASASGEPLWSLPMLAPRASEPVCRSARRHLAGQRRRSCSLQEAQQMLQQMEGMNPPLVSRRGAPPKLNVIACAIALQSASPMIVRRCGHVRLFGRSVGSTQGPAWLGPGRDLDLNPKLFGSLIWTLFGSEF